MRKCENCDMKFHVECLKQLSDTFGNTKTEKDISAEQTINETLTVEDGERRVATDRTLVEEKLNKTNAVPEELTETVKKENDEILTGSVETNQIKNNSSNETD